MITSKLCKNILKTNVWSFIFVLGFYAIFGSNSLFSQIIQINSDCINITDLPIVNSDGTGRNIYESGPVKIVWDNTNSRWLIKNNGTNMWLSNNGTSPDPPDNPVDWTANASACGIFSSLTYINSEVCDNGLAFLVRDIDLQDAVGVIGYLNGVSETPDIEVFAVDMTAVVELDGSVTSYSSINSNIPSNDTRGIVKVSFDSPIDKLRIIRKSNPNLATNPGYGAVEICDLTVCSGSSDTDSDGVLDYVDIDSDNDGIYDIVEAGFGSNDTDGDGFADGSVGLNGLLDSLETFVDSGELQNTVNDSNGNGTYDHVEIDSDGDGCNDVIEAGFLDSNNDGILGGLPLTVTVQGAVNYTP